VSGYRISFQLYTARKFPPVEAQLPILAEIGYDVVEPYGAAYHSDPAGFRARCDAVGLRIPTCHMPLADLDGDRARLIDVAMTLGLETVVVPVVPEDQRPDDVAGWKRLGARLAEHGEGLKTAGLGLAWHNHTFEFVRLSDGSRPIDHVLAGTQVKWEPDLGWLARGGIDIAAELGRFGGKIVAFHIKDPAPQGVTAEEGWTEVGAGTVDWRALWPAMKRAGGDILVPEHDNPGDWQRFARASLQFMRHLVGEG